MRGEAASGAALLCPPRDHAGRTRGPEQAAPVRLDPPRSSPHRGASRSRRPPPRRRGPGCARGGPRPRRVASKRRAPLQPAGHTCDLAGLRLEESRGSDQRLLREHLSPELRAPGTQSSRASGGDLRVARLWPWGLESHQPPLPLSVRRSRTPSWRCLESGTTGEAAGGTGAEGAGRGWRRGGVGV